MKKYLFIIIISSFVACHQKEIAKTNTSPPPANTAPASDPVSEVIINATADINDKGTAYNIDSVKIKDDILSVFVNYSGGCKPHTWDLISNGMYSKSLPPQIEVVLKHANNNDNCRRLSFRELKFNIARLKYQGNKTIVIKLADKEVHYTSK